jgi:23S rRNA pseudouridine2605 synthase
MMRLQKLLAGAGFGSRRTVEEWIRAGRITVGGRVAQLGDKATAADDVRLDGRKLELSRGTAVTREIIIYYKPAGEVTTRMDPEARPTVFDRLPEPKAGRWINVGRLDVNTSGLLLLTTDGELAHRLMHPSSEVEREYLVRLRGTPGPEVLRLLLEGVPLEDGPGRFDSIREEAPDGDPGTSGRDLSHSTYRVVLHEGRNREVRRLWQASGFEVSRLLRVRYGPVELPRDMRPGSTRPLEAGLAEQLDRASRGPASKQPGAGPINKGVNRRSAGPRNRAQAGDRPGGRRSGAGRPPRLSK